ncbi:MAG: YfhO family protein [Anaerolineales bacterium]
MSTRSREWLLALLVMAIAGALWILPLTLRPQQVPFWPGAAFSDLLISHWPNAEWIQQSIAEWGQIPLWNPNILSGIPFAADPLSGLWYPPNWLAVAFPGAIAFNTLFWIHLIWAGLGAWALAREEGLSKWGAVLVGIVFGGAPKFVAHIALGHVGLVSAVSWTPWVLLLTSKTLHQIRAEGRWLKWSALTGAVLGLVFRADPRWSIPLIGFAAAYGIRNTLRDRQTELKNLRRIALAGVVVGIFAAAIAACLGLPLWEFLRESTRSGISASEQAIFSLPLEGLLGTISILEGTPEWLAYFGASALVISVLSMLNSDRRPWFWIGVSVFSTLLALGPATPLFNLVSAIPGADVLRVPARFLFISALGWAFLAGNGLDTLISNTDVIKTKGVKIWLFAITSLILAVNIGTGIIGGINSIRQFGPVFTAILAFMLISIFLADRISLRRFIPLVLGIVVVDLLWVNIGLIEPKPVKAILSDRSGVASSLQSNHGASRVFSPSYSVPQPQAVLHGVELADGVNPLQLSVYRQYMETAVGLDAGAYDVTLPSFPEGDPSTPWGFQADIEALGRLNVEWIAADYPLEDDSLTSFGITDGVYLYRLEGSRTRSWIERGSAENDQDWQPIAISLWTPNWIRLQAAGPGVVVLSEVAYPGWRVFVDGEPSTLTTVNGLFRAVALDSGEHEVIFQFYPMTLIFGIAISSIGLLLLLFLWFRR